MFIIPTHKYYTIPKSKKYMWCTQREWAFWHRLMAMHSFLFEKQHSKCSMQNVYEQREAIFSVFKPIAKHIRYFVFALSHIFRKHWSGPFYVSQIMSPKNMCACEKEIDFCLQKWEAHMCISHRNRSSSTKNKKQGNLKWANDNYLSAKIRPMQTEVSVCIKYVHMCDIMHFSTFCPISIFHEIHSDFFVLYSSFCLWFQSALQRVEKKLWYEKWTAMRRTFIIIVIMLLFSFDRSSA